ncbi:MAG: DUF1566 domain-containing protein [Methylococcaceae bacterium]|nr:MAG: DUF1566 domain-containing protein [Methylococcaceae bacterium]
MKPTKLASRFLLGLALCLALTQTATARRLNDTGVTRCSSAGDSGLPCPVAGFEGQDGDYGRDAKDRRQVLEKKGFGAAGFDFTKIANGGGKLPGSAQQGEGVSDWACTYDNVTGLLWEVQTRYPGLRYLGNRYSWYDADPLTNGGDAGVQNGGLCIGGIACDTAAYIEAVNQLALCGFNDWRLPTVDELGSLIDYSKAYPAPAIDRRAFPDEIEPLSATSWTGRWVWSSTSQVDNPVSAGNAWSVSFSRGSNDAGGKNGAFAVRLVRGKK